MSAVMDMLESHFKLDFVFGFKMISTDDFRMVNPVVKFGRLAK